MSIDRCKCPVCAALPSNPTLTARDATEAGYASSTATQQWRAGRGATITGALPGAQELGSEPLTIFDLVKADLDERDKLGHERFKRPLTVDTYDQWLAMAYEEALDLAVYLRGALAEGEAGKSRREAFDRMSKEELEEYARTSKLPEWVRLAGREGKK